MLTITVPVSESESFSLDLEHSLVSLSKWESKFERPFLGPGEKSSEEILSYIECMTISTGVPSGLYSKLTNENFEAINNYINAKMTATWFNDNPNAPKSREIVTSELVYYWMFSMGIPIECENWHLNRLFTLVRVFSVKNSPPKRMSKSEMAAQRSALNAKRLQELQTRG